MKHSEGCRNGKIREIRVELNLRRAQASLYLVADEVDHFHLLLFEQLSPQKVILNVCVEWFLVLLPSVLRWSSPPFFWCFNQNILKIVFFFFDLNVEAKL